MGVHSRLAIDLTSVCRAYRGRNLVLSRPCVDAHPPSCRLREIHYLLMVGLRTGAHLPSLPSRQASYLLLPSRRRPPSVESLCLSQKIFDPRRVLILLPLMGVHSWRIIDLPPVRRPAYRLSWEASRPLSSSRRHPSTVLSANCARYIISSWLVLALIHACLPSLPSR